MFGKSSLKTVGNYFVKDNKLYEYQSGFRKAHSTDTCLIYLLDHVKINNVSGLYVGMVLLELRKAFDTVDHHSYAIS